MSKPANKTLIGAFVVGATALLLLAIAVFGSGKLFQTTSRYVLFFDGSISGLSVGSPVLFRGVPVGRVVEIRLTGDLDNLVFQTPVFIELNKKDEGRFSVSDGDISKKEYLDRLVSHGLRATLATQSLLTGQLMIEMDFYPRSQIPYPIKEVKEYDDVPEIPTIPSQFDNILQTLTTLPYDDIASNVLDITEGVKKILSNSGTEQLIGHIDKLVVQLQDIGTNLDKTLTSIRGLAEPYTKLAQDTDKRLSAALEQASHVLSRIDNVAKETEMTVVSARGEVSKNSTTVIELNQAIRRNHRSGPGRSRVRPTRLNAIPKQCCAGRYGKGTYWGGEEPPFWRKGAPPLLYQRLSTGRVSGSSNRSGTGLKAESCALDWAQDCILKNDAMGPRTRKRITSV